MVIKKQTSAKVYNTVTVRYSDEYVMTSDVISNRKSFIYYSE